MNKWIVDESTKQIIHIKYPILDNSSISLPVLILAVPSPWLELSHAFRIRGDFDCRKRKMFIIPQFFRHFYSHLKKYAQRHTNILCMLQLELGLSRLVRSIDPVCQGGSVWSWWLVANPSPRPVAIGRQYRMDTRWDGTMEARIYILVDSTDSHLWISYAVCTVHLPKESVGEITNLFNSYTRNLKLPFKEINLQISFQVLHTPNSLNWENHLDFWWV